MPKMGVTVYDLLLSCPNDVADLKTSIEECVKSFNISIGEVNNIRVDLKHWSTDSYAQSGDKPQKLLNKQFIDNCDLCVALLGTRFGTPTDEYDSGTEEEIEKMISQGKQVFLYFIERKIDPNSIDMEQYAKVKAFKEKYNGIYKPVKDSNELRKLFQNDLSLHFIRLAIPHASGIATVTTPDLLITNQLKQKNKIKLGNTNYKNIKLVADKYAEIKDLISKIENIKLEVSTILKEEITVPSIPDEKIEKMSAGEFLKAKKDNKISLDQIYRVFGKTQPSYEKIKISNDKKTLICTFLEKYDIKISDNFWFLGNLIRENSITLVSPYGNSSPRLSGSETEKEKYQLIEDLSYKINQFNDIVEYFDKLDGLFYLSLIVSNIGTTYDEDLDIKLFIEKDCLIDINKFPIPGILFIDYVIEVEAPKLLFTGNCSPEIEDYSNYPKFIPMPKYLDFPFKSSEEIIKEQREKYQNLLKNVFCYDYRKTDKEDVLIFNVPYLKQNTQMYFPSYLFFTKAPKSIRYEIRSKHSPKVYEGNIEIENIEGD